MEKTVTVTQLVIPIYRHTQDSPAVFTTAKVFQVDMPGT